MHMVKYPLCIEIQTTSFKNKNLFLLLFNMSITSVHHRMNIRYILLFCVFLLSVFLTLREACPRVVLSFVMVISYKGWRIQESGKGLGSQGFCGSLWMLAAYLLGYPWQQPPSVGVQPRRTNMGRPCCITEEVKAFFLELGFFFFFGCPVACGVPRLKIMS